jgi:PKD repeat protein
MRAAITSSVASRSSLITASNLLATGVTNPALCVADFEFNKNILCAGDSVAFNDISYHDITSWNWNFGDGVTLVGSDPAVHQNPTHVYATPGTFSITLTVSNGADQLSKTYSNVITVLDGKLAYKGLEEAMHRSFVFQHIAKSSIARLLVRQVQIVQ